MSDHAINVLLLIIAIFTGVSEVGIFWMILQDYRKARGMPELPAKRLLVMGALSLGPLFALCVVYLFAEQLRQSGTTQPMKWIPWVLICVLALIVFALGYDRQKNLASPPIQISSPPWLDAIADEDIREMDRKLSYIFERMKAVPKLEAIEPYIDLTFYLLNSSVFTLILERVEGKVTYGPHGGPPLQSQPDIPENGFRMPHGFQGELVLRQWILPETASTLAKSKSVTLGTGRFALWFGYADHLGKKQNVRKAFPDFMFTIQSES